MSNPKENEYVSTLNFRSDNYPELVRIANELAKLEDRKPHDSIKRLIEEEGQKKINRLKSEEDQK